MKDATTGKVIRVKKCIRFCKREEDQIEEFIKEWDKKKEIAPDQEIQALCDLLNETYHKRFFPYQTRDIVTMKRMITRLRFRALGSAWAQRKHPYGERRDSPKKKKLPPPIIVIPTTPIAEKTDSGEVVYADAALLAESIEPGKNPKKFTSDDNVILAVISVIRSVYERTCKARDEAIEERNNAFDDLARITNELDSLKTKKLNGALDAIDAIKAKAIADIRNA
jgi:hypothetical protein